VIPLVGLLITSFDFLATVTMIVKHL